MQAIDIKYLKKQYATLNRPLTAIILSEAEWDELEGDVCPQDVYPRASSNIMYLYGIAIIKKQEVYEK